MRATDWLLLLACAALILVGPVMAYQEWRAHEDAQATLDMTGRLPLRDPTFRAAWRLPLVALVLAVGVLGTYATLRVLANPIARRVSRRLVALLLVGMTILDLAYLADTRLFLDAPYALRAATIVWAYPLGALLVGGAAQRLAEVREHFTR